MRHRFSFVVTLMVVIMICSMVYAPASPAVVIAGSDALYDLTVSSGSLNPSFDPEIKSYTLGVPNMVSSFYITPSALDSNATISVNGNNAAGGSQYGPISLNVGATTIIIRVYPDMIGASPNVYTLVVNRQAPTANTSLSSLYLSQGNLSPGFSPDTTDYSAAVPFSVPSIRVTPTAADSNTNLTVNGSALSSGQTSGTIALGVGTNTITIATEGPPGSTPHTYTVTVTRGSNYSGNSYLSNLYLSQGSLSPAFNPGTMNYSSVLSASTASVRIVAQPSDSNASVRINGVLLSNGQAGYPINLGTGANTVTVQVMADDGSTRNYGITVYRGSSSNNASLSDLVLSQGILSPVFTPGNTAYYTAVPSSASAIAITPYAAENNAVIRINGSITASGFASSPISLQSGSTAIQIGVTAPDGQTQRTYTLTVNKGTTGDAQLSGLVLGVGTLSPSFSPAVTFYTAAVNSSISSLPITAVAADPRIQISINGKSVANGYASPAFPLSQGTNTFAILVTSADNTATKTYVVNVVRPASGGSARFSDLSGNPALTAIMAMVSRGYVSGYANGTFQPNRSMTRGEFVIAVSKAYRLTPDNYYALKFKDKRTLPATVKGYAAAALKAGLIPASWNASFNANTAVTRGEMAYMIVRAEKAPLANIPAPALADTVPAWQRGAVAYVLNNNLLDPYPDNTFMANKPATRAEICTLLANALSN